MEHDLNDSWHNIKIYNCDPFSVLLAIAAYGCFCAPGSNMRMLIMKSKKSFVILTAVCVAYQ